MGVALFQVKRIKDITGLVVTFCNCFANASNMAWSIRADFYQGTILNFTDLLASKRLYLLLPRLIFNKKFCRKLTILSLKLTYISDIGFNLNHFVKAFLTSQETPKY